MVNYNVNITIPDKYISSEEKRVWLEELCRWGAKNLENVDFWISTAGMYNDTKHITNSTISITFLCTNEQDAISLKLGWT